MAVWRPICVLHISIFCFCTLLTTKALSLKPPSSLTDVEFLLYKIKPVLQGNSDNVMLSSWNTNTPLCQWRGLKWVFSNGSFLNCEDLSSPQWSNLTLYKHQSLHILSLQLPSNLSGSIPREFGELSALQSLYLIFNSLSGSVPLELGYSSSLSDIDLGQNLLSRSLFPSIWNLCDRIASLNLHGNSVTGSLPDPALPNSTCDNLKILDLGENKFSGGFPEFVTRFRNIQELDLNHNILNGSLPMSINDLKLEKLDLSYNNFSGLLPNFGGTKFGVEAFDGNNPSLCGHPLRSCNGDSKLSSGRLLGLLLV